MKLCQIDCSDLFFFGGGHSILLYNRSCFLCLPHVILGFQKSPKKSLRDHIIVGFFIGMIPSHQYMILVCTHSILYADWDWGDGIYYWFLCFLLQKYALSSRDMQYHVNCQNLCHHQPGKLFVGTSCMLAIDMCCGQKSELRWLKCQPSFIHVVLYFTRSNYFCILFLQWFCIVIKFFC